ncbi:STAS domain-containing protein [Marinigracilibium pacificum]|uniref:Anti-sigma factor antagonist n=1 Tax=Marinigracilibium pacificum TaxID=2729599 RepID=A0A848IUE8_9BACT|nr:STAS domain-containing protein [Marinigracilibium pacificum]NMM46818.1 STAS domain-containing protein [Marinigracilibium pacificum]
MLEISTKKNDGIYHVIITGEVDASSSIELDKQISMALDKGEGKLLIDCSGLSYISSAGLGVFMSYVEPMESDGRKMVICGLNNKVFNTFEILGLHQVLTIKSNEQDAKSYLNEV